MDVTPTSPKCFEHGLLKRWTNILRIRFKHFSVTLFSVFWTFRKKVCLRLEYFCLSIPPQVSCTTTVHVSLGHQIFLQIMMRHFRRRLRLLDTISRIVTLYPNYLSSTSIAHTLLWILVQNVQSSDIVIWFEYLLTAYTESATSSVTTVKRLAVEHIRLVMQR